MSIKKILVLGMSIILAVSIAACGSRVNNEGTDKTKESAKTQIETQTVEDTQIAQTSEVPESVTQQTEEMTTESVQRTELSNYMTDERLPELKTQFKFKETDSSVFGDGGVRYEKDGLGVEWITYQDGTPTNISVDCQDNGLFCMEGIYCGQAYKEAKNIMEGKDWHIVGNDLKHPEAFYMSTDHGQYMLQFTVDEATDTLSGWYWCNWPEGDFEIH